ncbi:hypothetical protein JAAARDRAFT_197391 [Jaapia argillacea MUCL 33604]|uniref:Uncharacterized protein n=1 Tax=Jaapia argillacea MUCL 33604 TaxID=933084 RepID=A0A067PQK3_9AGAM|nr:hypothetical protein JAAARDRAFT_197391 [Jaapia argillacea MUCL 33604]
MSDREGEDDGGEIGRGRKSRGVDDSSSSRESSPKGYFTKPIHSLSPISDDEGIVIPEDPDASPPPSAVQPIIRQAVAFAADMPKEGVVTYKATIEPPSAGTFLPGQAVDVPQPPKPPSMFPVPALVPYAPPVQKHTIPFPGMATLNPTPKPKPKKASGRKKKHFNDAFVEQTDKFRLYHYENDPKSAVPVEQPLTGPYGSLYRGTGTSSHSAPSTSSRQASASGSQSTSTSLGASSSTSDYFSSLGDAASPDAGTEAGISYASSSTVKSSSSRGKGKAKAAGRPSKKKKDGHSHSHSQSSSKDGAEYDFSKYYRFDYDKQKLITTGYRPDSPSRPASSSSRGKKSDRDQQFCRDDVGLGIFDSPSPSNTVNSLQEARGGTPVGGEYQSEPGPGGSAAAEPNSSSSATPNPSSSTNKAASSSGSTPGLRILTLLIEDHRSREKVDPQLAEVRVPLRQADTPEDGYWANAQDVCTQLQEGPTRIDGPARAFCFRGKYRQFFLRVGLDNVDKITPQNLSVSKERTLEVFVEKLPPIDGEVPPPFLAVEEANSDTETMNSPSRDPYAPIDPVKNRHQYITDPPGPDYPRTRPAYITDPTPPNYMAARSPYVTDPPTPNYPGVRSPYVTDPPPPHSPYPRGYSGVDPISSVPQKRQRGSGSSHVSSGPYSQHNSLPYSYSPSPSTSHTPYGSPAYDPRSPSPATYHSGLGNAPPKKSKTAAKDPTQDGRHYDGSVSAGNMYSWPPPAGPSAAPGATQPTGPRFYPTQITPYAPPNTSTNSAPTGYPPPNKEEIHQIVVSYVKPRIEADTDWIPYVQTKSRVLTATEIVAQYQFVQKQVNIFCGATTPSSLPGAPNQNIGRSHVLKALNLSHQFGAECAETLKLIAFYGPGGTRYVDSRVVDLMNERPGKGPLTPGNTPKKLLNLLREIDDDWKTDHPEDD